jgi:FMN phosphatase YigB (HAD superfamily)
MAIESGYEGVLATNPVFPREVILERMRWAGVADLAWKLITSYEDMHFAKPHAAYHSEILGRIGRQPAACVIVGNDTRDDLAALAVGVKAFLLEGRVVDRGNAPCPTWKGPVEVLQSLLVNHFSVQEGVHTRRNMYPHPLALARTGEAGSLSVAAVFHP